MFKCRPPQHSRHTGTTCRQTTLVHLAPFTVLLRDLSQTLDTVYRLLNASLITHPSLRIPKTKCPLGNCLAVH